MYLMGIENDSNKSVPSHKQKKKKRKKKRRNTTTENKKIMVKNILDLNFTHKPTIWNRCL